MTRLEFAYNAGAVALAGLGLAATMQNLVLTAGALFLGAAGCIGGSNRERRARQPRACCQFGASSSGVAHSPGCRRGPAASAETGWEQRLARTRPVVECPPSSTGRCIAWDKCVTAEGECVEDRGSA
ncbi:hypothetical protein B0675_02135 [Streptomyces sp. M41(2017)]|uniref:hypothetical protein n=1 Tax=Streptomyces sp. M41(2017) TaxID=1955065 RepID=UPI0009BCCF78|nr:hypothetical protein [Streptomyces sp. M41(2017)]OQQ16106.1 hypothetical protein B0675_02135 [Streptomyces sp. M41(2017)]